MSVKIHISGCHEQREVAKELMQLIWRHGGTTEQDYWTRDVGRLPTLDVNDMLEADIIIVLLVGDMDEMRMGAQLGTISTLQHVKEHFGEVWFLLDPSQGHRYHDYGCTPSAAFTERKQLVDAIIYVLSPELNFDNSFVPPDDNPHKDSYEYSVRYQSAVEVRALRMQGCEKEITEITEMDRKSVRCMNCYTIPRDCMDFPREDDLLLYIITEEHVEWLELWKENTRLTKYTEPEKFSMHTERSGKKEAARWTLASPFLPMGFYQPRKRPQIRMSHPSVVYHVKLERVLPLKTSELTFYLHGSNPGMARGDKDDGITFLT